MFKLFRSKESISASTWKKIHTDDFAIGVEYLSDGKEAAMYVAFKNQDDKNLYMSLLEKEYGLHELLSSSKVPYSVSLRNSDLDQIATKVSLPMNVGKKATQWLLMPSLDLFQAKKEQLKNSSSAQDSTQKIPHSERVSQFEVMETDQPMSKKT